MNMFLQTKTTGVRPERKEIVILTKLLTLGRKVLVRIPLVGNTGASIDLLNSSCGVKILYAAI
jgi:hypothetical protein